MAAFSPNRLGGCGGFFWKQAERKRNEMAKGKVAQALRQQQEGDGDGFSDAESAAVPIQCSPSVPPRGPPRGGVSAPPTGPTGEELRIPGDVTNKDASGGEEEEESLPVYGPVNRWEMGEVDTEYMEYGPARAGGGADTEYGPVGGAGGGAEVDDFLIRMEEEEHFDEVSSHSSSWK